MFRFTAPAVLLVTATSAHAEIPPPVRAIIEAAVATGDAQKVATVIELAKQTNPADAAEIEAIHLSFKQDQAEAKRLAEEAKTREIRNAGVFDRWSGEGQIGAFQSSGNNDNVGVNTALKMKRQGEDWSHQLRATADYQRSNGTTTREQYFAAYEPRYKIDDGLFAYGLAQYERDKFQGFRGRYAVSSGLGYHLLKRDNVRLAVKAGPAYRVTEFVGGTSEKRIAGLLGFDFDWTIADGLTLTQDSNLMAETGGSATVIVDSSNTSLNLVTGLQAKLTDRLSTRLSYTIEYDTNPPPGAVATDTLSRFTLIYGF